MKRSSPSADGDGQSSKKRKILRPKHHRLTNVQPGSAFVLENPQDETIISEQLSKGLAVALVEAGFEGAQPEALASLQAATEEYMIHFTRRVTSSMRHCRRTDPLPQDFISALASFGLTPSSLFADLKLSVPANETQAPVLPPSPTTHTFPREFSPPPPVTNALDPTHTFKRSYVPKHFPSLPGTHSYKDTPVYTARETDARKIREMSTKEGMQAEQALRKLMAASKAGKLKKKRMEGLVRDEKWRREEDSFRKAMDAVKDEVKSETVPGAVHDNEIMISSLDGANDRDHSASLDEDIEAGSYVNYERAYWRKSAVDHPLDVGS